MTSSSSVLVWYARYLHVQREDDVRVADARAAVEHGQVPRGRRVEDVPLAVRLEVVRRDTLRSARDVHLQVVVGVGADHQRAVLQQTKHAVVTSVKIGPVYKRVASQQIKHAGVGLEMTHRSKDEGKTLTCASNGKNEISMSQVVLKMPPGSQCIVPSYFSSTRIRSKSGISSSALQARVRQTTRHAGPSSRRQSHVYSHNSGLSHSIRKTQR